jgi:hypothetical protein
MISECFSIENIAAEIALCDVVCANCHRRRTARRMGWRQGREFGLRVASAVFDSTVPDLWVARRWCAGILGMDPVMGSIPMRSTMPGKLRR